MALNILKSVRIGSMDYKVELTDEVILVEHKECFGSADFNNKVIKINTELHHTQGQEETLLHEIFHAITHERNFSYDKNDDETITEELARGLHQLIKDNPKLFELSDTIIPNK